MLRRQRLTGPTMYEIRLIVQTDDEGEVERLSDAICAVACPVDDEVATDEHECRVPWFVITSTMSTKNAESWRATLNH